MRPRQAAGVELVVDLGDPLLDVGALERQRQIAEPQRQQLLVGPRRPFRLGHQRGGVRADQAVSRS